MDLLVVKQSNLPDWQLNLSLGFVRYLMYSIVSIYKTIALKQSLILHVAPLNVLPVLLAHLFFFFF